jgi:hypothetical protein
MKLALLIESDEPIEVHVMVRKAAPRSVPPFAVAKRIVETTGEGADERETIKLRKVG